MKPTLCLDFDGVIHSYQSGWQGADRVDDDPTPGALAFIERAQAHFRVAVFSSRSQQPGGLPAMQRWLDQQLRRYTDANRAAAIYRAIEWPTAKPAAFLTLDDRAMTFCGVWPTIETLRAFEPWYKKIPNLGDGVTPLTVEE